MPPGAHNPEVYFRARAGSFLADPGLTLEEAYEDQLGKAIRFT